jgi:RNA-binding protein YlmH
LSGCEDIEYGFEGGYTGAERAVAVFYNDFSNIDAYDPKSFFKLVNINLNGRDNLSHRDYLGSLMGLGIKREKTGDIVISGEHCDIVVISEIADYIFYNLDKVGNTKVNVQIKDLDEINVPEPKVREISVTVASLRLDSVSAPGFGMSRSKVVDFIKAGKLNLNWEMTDNPDKLVKEGDNISIRGKGRLVIKKVGGKTKKDRTGIILKKYL